MNGRIKTPTNTATLHSAMASGFLLACIIAILFGRLLGWIRLDEYQRAAAHWWILCAGYLAFNVATVIVAAITGEREFKIDRYTFRWPLLALIVGAVAQVVLDPYVWEAWRIVGITLVTFIIEYAFVLVMDRMRDAYRSQQQAPAPTPAPTPAPAAPTPPPANPRPSLRVTAPGTITLGQGITFQITSQNATSVTLDGHPGVNVPLNGPWDLPTPPAAAGPANFRFRAHGPGGDRQFNVTVTVNP